MAAFSIQDLLLTAYKLADQDFRQASFMPGSTVNGIKVGTLSFFRHAFHETDLKKIITGFDNANENDLITEIAIYLQDTGCLWDPGDLKGNNHSFNNFFLIALRELDKKYGNQGTEIYRQIIEQAYNVVFLRGEQTLYRCEINDRFHSICAQGFENDHAPEPSRFALQQASEGVTRTFGISTSKHAMKTEDYTGVSDTRNHQYGNYRYKIKLPDNHNLLLLDINAGLNKKKASEQTRIVQEVNCLDTIPPKYIKHQKKILVEYNELVMRQFTLKKYKDKDHLTKEYNPKIIMLTTSTKNNPSFDTKNPSPNSNLTRRGCF